MNQHQDASIVNLRRVPQYLADIRESNDAVVPENTVFVSTPTSAISRANGGHPLHGANDYRGYNSNMNITASMRNLMPLDTDRIRN